MDSKTRKAVCDYLLKEVGRENISDFHTTDKSIVYITFEGERKIVPLSKVIGKE